MINLLGHAAGVPANIYGNIELQSDADDINVQTGETQVQRCRQLGLHAGRRSDCA